MANDGYVQIGVTALRDPLTGGFLPEVPLYIRECDCEPDAEGRLISDIGKLLAERMKQYHAECEAAGASI